MFARGSNCGGMEGFESGRRMPPHPGFARTVSHPLPTIGEGPSPEAKRVAGTSSSRARRSDPGMQRWAVPAEIPADYPMALSESSPHGATADIAAASRRLDCFAPLAKTGEGDGPAPAAAEIPARWEKGFGQIKGRLPRSGQAAALVVQPMGGKSEEAGW